MEMLSTTSLWLVLVTKYLSIYHSHWINNIDEEKVVTRFKWTLATLPEVLVTIEFLVLSNMKDLDTFEIFRGLQPTSESGVEVMPLLAYPFLLITGLVLQTRLELDHISHEEDGCLASILKVFDFKKQAHENPKSPYKINALRLLFGLCLGFIFLAMYTMLKRVQQLKNTFVVYHVIFLSIGPSIFVYFHDGLKNIATTRIKSCFAHQDLFMLKI